MGKNNIFLHVIFTIIAIIGGKFTTA